MKQETKSGLKNHTFAPWFIKLRYDLISWQIIFAGFFLFFLAGCASQPLRPPDTAKAGRVVSLARSLEGTPYRYGGNSPSQGFDCSGLVVYVYQKAAGRKLPRISRHQFKIARPVRLGLERPADLLFFDINGRGISHVGIYLGKGKFIHAPKTGGKVKISDANKKYWRQRFRGVRRVL
ncbi:C40 family peptidase [bacterium]|nr:C40 family peptidase [bacterium]